MKCSPLLLIVLAFTINLAQCAEDPESQRAPSADSLRPTEAERDARLGWWREARFGMFIHWGVYSELGGTWQGKQTNGYAEHIQRICKIPIPIYRKEVAGNFNPTAFNAEEWVKLAKATGMGYLIITAKHHDGFAMYDSKVSDYNIVRATPFARDPMKDLREACRKYGIKFGFYYSHAFDWGEKDAPGNDWDYSNPGGDRLLFGSKWWEKDPAFLPQVRSYVDNKAIPQILELIQNYDPDIMWFDTPHKLPPEENLRILAAIRKAKPSMVINGRLVSGGFGEMGDYQNTSDRPAEFPPQAGDWEGVPTTNESYGYNQNDNSYKSPEHFIRLLAKAVARGGNILMNVGPMGDGRINPKDLEILRGIGHWWAINGESIRGTTITPLEVQSWGESTRKGNQLFLHVFQWPKDGHLIIGGLLTPVTKAELLANPGSSLKVTAQGEDVLLDVPPTAPDATDSVIVLTCAEAPQADSARLISSSMVNQLRSFDGKIEGDLKYGDGKTAKAWVFNWNKPADAVVWPSRLSRGGTFDVSVLYDAPSKEESGSINGDAGKEATEGQAGAGGTFQVNLGTKSMPGVVKIGTNVSTDLGSVTLGPGPFDIRISAVQITGQELMRLRSVVLTPRKPLPNE